MWAKKGADQDALFESGVEWFSAPYNVSSITKPKKIKDWEGDQTCYDVMSKDVRWNKPRAEKQLQDLSDIALDYTLNMCQGETNIYSWGERRELTPYCFPR